MLSSHFFFPVQVNIVKVNVCSFLCLPFLTRTFRLSLAYPLTCFPCRVNSFFQYGSCLVSVVPGRFEIPLPLFGCSRVKKLAISAILEKEDKGSVKKLGRYASSWLWIRVCSAWSNLEEWGSGLPFLREKNCRRKERWRGNCLTLRQENHRFWNPLWSPFDWLPLVAS